MRVPQTTWAKGIPGAEEALVGDIRNRGLWTRLAKMGVLCVGLSCQSASAAGKGRSRDAPQNI
eukprot:8128441-Alexandrium_andersonii.AAC.1